APFRLPPGEQSQAADHLLHELRLGQDVTGIRRVPAGHGVADLVDPGFDPEAELLRDVVHPCAEQGQLLKELLCAVRVCARALLHDVPLPVPSSWPAASLTSAQSEAYARPASECG